MIEFILCTIILDKLDLLHGFTYILWLIWFLNEICRMVLIFTGKRK